MNSEGKYVQYRIFNAGIVGPRDFDRTHFSCNSIFKDTLN